MQEPFDEKFKYIADSMGLSLYQRFTLNEASLFLRCPIEEVEALVAEQKIDFIRISKKRVEFFGYQLVQHLLTTIAKDSFSPQTQDLPERIIKVKEVQSITGLSRTTIWREEQKSRFPKRVPLSSSSVGWRYSGVIEWINSRKF